MDQRHGVDNQSFYTEIMSRLVQPNIKNHEAFRIMKLLKKRDCRPTQAERPISMLVLLLNPSDLSLDHDLRLGIPCWKRMTLLIKRRNLCQREGAQPRPLCMYLPSGHILPVCLLLVFQVDVIVENESPQLLQHPPSPFPTAHGLHTLTLLAVLHCTVLSKQAVQHLGARRREEATLSIRNCHEASHRTSSPQGTGRALGGDLSSMTCLAYSFQGTDTAGNLSGYLCRKVLEHTKGI